MDNSRLSPSLYHTRTKIIATIGPASMLKEVLYSMFLSGLDVCRINASHGTHEMHLKVIENVKALNRELKTHVAILYDLQGPKLRIGEVKNDKIILADNGELVLTTQEMIGDEKKIYIKYPSIINDVKQGDTILVDDGKIALEVMDSNHTDSIRTRIIHGGELSSKKGVNLPNTKISLPSLTDKDLKDLDFALSHEVEYIGLSFVRKPEDISGLRKKIKTAGKNARIVAKIEKPEAVECIDEITVVSDAIMVARGDLGVELPQEKIPLIQKMIVKKCIALARPVIIATQMMESMIDHYAPTRAEVSDVGNSVMDGADALMLSNETSVGKYPVEAVRSMHRIIENVEEEESIYYRESLPVKDSSSLISDSISFHAVQMARQTRADAICVMTHSGYSALKIAGQRPHAKIFAFTDNLMLLNKLSLVWGIRGFYYNKYESTDRTISDIKTFLKEHGYIHDGELIIHVASTPLHERTTANMIKLNYV